MSMVCPKCGKKASPLVSTFGPATCIPCHEVEKVHYELGEKLQAVLTSTLPSLGMAQPSVGNHRVEHVEHSGLSSKASGYVLHFRLPRWNGKLEITDGTIAELETEQAIAVHVTTQLHQAARELRGRALLELLETDWAMPPDAKKEDFQRLERALVSLIERTEK
jgi:hypothetical protein